MLVGQCHATCKPLASLAVAAQRWLSCCVHCAAVQAMSELRVSLQRFEGFLRTPEPPAPNHLAHQVRALFRPGRVLLCVVSVLRLVPKQAKS